MFLKYCLTLLFVFPVLAGPIEDTFGAGARNKGMAGAATNIAEDFTATFYNPALLALCRGSRLSLGYDYIHTGLQSNPPADQLDNYHSMNMGFCLKPLNQAGIGLYGNFSMGPIQFTPSTLNVEPNFIMYGGDLKAYSMIMGMGYAPIKQFALGAAMSMATGVGLETDLTVNTAIPPRIVAKFPAQISPLVGAIVGVLGMPVPNWRLGLVYRSATYGQLNILAKGNLDNMNLAETQIRGFLSYAPHQISLGSSYLLDSWLLTADLTYYVWSKYPGPFLEIANSNQSLIAPSFKITSTEPANFSDVLVPRCGIEYSAWDKLRLRAGYSFRPTPAPTPSGKAQLLDATAHRIALGAGYEMQLYQNIFLIADTFFTADILQNSRGTAFNTGILLGAEYD